MKNPFYNNAEYEIPRRAKEVLEYTGYIRDISIQIPLHDIGKYSDEHMQPESQILFRDNPRQPVLP